MEQTALEENAPISFKALRAKFQEEALLAQSKSTRPAVADKPKHLPPPGGHCSPSVTCAGVDGKALVVPRAIFRDGLRGSGGKRPISFPPQVHQACTSPQDESTTTRQTMKERHMHLVLPVLPVKNQKLESPTEKDGKPATDLGKEVLPHTRVKKKGLLLPFQSARTSKFHVEDVEETSFLDLTNRPASAPGELPSIEKQSVEDGVSLQSDQSTTEYPPSSPDIPRTPPLSEVRSNSDSRIFSSLEKAKRKFTPRQILSSTKPKRLNSPEYASREKVLPSSAKISDNFCSPAPIAAPTCLPHLAYISARPFFKNSAHKFVFEKQYLRENVEGSSVRSAEPLSPPWKQLPELGTLGPPPAKPTRPPLVDLSCYQTPIVKEQSASDLSKEQPLVHPSTSNTIMDAPEFPDFDNSEIETDGEAVDIAALELEALDVLGSEIGMPAPFEVPGCEALQPEPLAGATETIESSIVRDLNLGSQNIIPLDPASSPEPINLPEFPEPSAPEQRSQSKESAAESFSSSRSDETLSTVVKRQCVPEDVELTSHTAKSDERQTQPSARQQDGCHEVHDNLYEDVETVNKIMSGQISIKQRGTLKNPYAENRPLREEPCFNKRLRHPWSSAQGEHAQVHHHVHSKEHLSPNTADYKEQRKREKQRLERERKEQKEREKKENEMKKKFKVTGDEEPMYQAKVTATSKVRKHDLPVKSGDMVSIIRTTNCPKGKWLARDSNNKYGYISVMNVELNIKDMLEFGKKAQAAGRGANQEGDTISIGSRSSSHPIMTSSFTDDSEEWACEDETLSPSNESHSFPQQNSSLPETSCLQSGDASLEDLHTQNRHEALQKLAFFFQHNKDALGDFADGEGTTPTNAETSNYLCAVEEPPYPEQEVDFTELELLPPPPLYADSF